MQFRGRAPWHAGPEHVYTQSEKSDLAASFARGGLGEDTRAQVRESGGTQTSAPRAGKKITHTGLAAYIAAPSTLTAATTFLRSRALRLRPSRVALEPHNPPFTSSCVSRDRDAINSGSKIPIKRQTTSTRSSYHVLEYRPNKRFTDIRISVRYHRWVTQMTQP